MTRLANFRYCDGIGHGTVAGRKISLWSYCSAGACSAASSACASSMPWAAACSNQERLSRVRLAGGAFGEVAAEHQLGLAVAELGGGAEPPLRRPPVLGQVVAAG